MSVIVFSVRGAIEGIVADHLIVDAVYLVGQILVVGLHAGVNDGDQGGCLWLPDVPGKVCLNLLRTVLYSVVVVEVVGGGGRAADIVGFRVENGRILLQLRDGVLDGDPGAQAHAVDIRHRMLPDHLTDGCNRLKRLRARRSIATNADQHLAGNIGGRIALRGYSLREACCQRNHGQQQKGKRECVSFHELLPRRICLTLERAPRNGYTNYEERTPARFDADAPGVTSSAPVYSLAAIDSLTTPFKHILYPCASLRANIVFLPGLRHRGGFPVITPPSRSLGVFGREDTNREPGRTSPG